MPIVAGLLIMAVVAIIVAKLIIVFMVRICTVCAICCTEVYTFMVVWPTRPSCKRPVGVEGKEQSSGSID